MLALHGDEGRAPFFLQAAPYKIAMNALQERITAFAFYF